MISSIRDFYARKPLSTILLVGLALRLLAAVYSKGYAMTDDHFKIIAEAGYKLHDKPSTFWTPDYSDKKSKRAMLYPYANYLVIDGLYKIGFNDPQNIMLVIRLLHAIFSMLIIWLSYKITVLISTEWAARLAAWIAAIFWFLPMMSVRNLIEVVCIPFIMAGTYLVLKAYLKTRAKSLYFWAGVLFSFAFTIRYQSVFFTAGLGIYLLFKKDWKAAALMLLGFIIPIFPNHLYLETVLFDFAPFQKFINYIEYNLEHSGAYVLGPWYNFLLLFLGVFVPPFSFILAWGMFRSWKKYMILLFPFLLFMIFHSWFPGKQERFILPVFMFFPILGLVGYEELRKTNQWIIKRPNFFKYSFRAFLIVNFILLIPITFTYSKRSRVEAMYYLHDKPSEEKDVLVFGAGRIRDVNLMPVFYSSYEKYPEYFKVSNDDEVKELTTILGTRSKERQVDYIFMVEHEGMKQKMKLFSEYYQVEYIKMIDASFIDKTMHWLNPRNKNYNIHVYKVLGKNEKKI